MEKRIMYCGLCLHVAVNILTAVIVKKCMAYITGSPESDTLTDRLTQKRLFV